MRAMPHRFAAIALATLAVLAWAPTPAPAQSLAPPAAPEPATGDDTASSPAPAPVALVVLDFANRSSDRTLDWLGKGLADMVIHDLTVARRVTVVDRERTQEVLRELALTPATAQAQAGGAGGTGGAGGQAG